MPTPITVNIPHDVGKAEARRRIEEGFGSLEEQLSGGTLKMTFKERWENDRLHFTGGTFGQTVRGHVDVMEDAVVVEVLLPRLLAALAGSLKGKLEKQGARLLEHRK